MFQTLESRPLFALIYWYHAVSGIFEALFGLVLTAGLFLFGQSTIQSYVLAKGSGQVLSSLIDLVAYISINLSSTWLLQVVTISGSVFVLTGCCKLLVINGLARHTNRSLRGTVLILFILACLYFVDLWFLFSWIKVMYCCIAMSSVIFVWRHMQSDDIAEGEDSFNPAA